MVAKRRCFMDQLQEHFYITSKSIRQVWVSRHRSNLGQSMPFAMSKNYYTLGIFLVQCYPTTPPMCGALLGNHANQHLDQALPRNQIFCMYPFITNDFERVKEGLKPRAEWIVQTNHTLSDEYLKSSYGETVS